MNLIFLNSLERRVEENRVKTAQVSICEQQGAWHVLWNEAREDGKLEQSSWFEGTQWDVMLQVFRERLQEKIKEGYIPLLDGYGEAERLVSYRSRETQMLYHYSELHRKEEVYNLLRLWRKEEASKDGRAAYIVASNRILDMISAFLPHTLEELKQIPGLGESRTRTYGDAILAITKDFQRETEFPLHWVNERINMQQFEIWLSEQSRIRQETEEAKLAGKRKLLEAIAQGGDLSSLEKLLLMKRRDILLAVEELAKEGYDVDTLIETELGSIDHEEQRQVQVLFAELGDKYLKPVLFKLYNEQQLKEKDVNKTYEWMRLIRLKHRKQNAV
ncbi:MAG: HRDC domain-containing protein [Paenibacillaceae bacterium]